MNPWHLLVVDTASLGGKEGDASDTAAGTLTLSQCVSGELADFSLSSTVANNSHPLSEFPFVVEELVLSEAGTGMS